jgi:hypothetical protein
MTHHQRKVEAAENAITAVFEDTSVSQKTTLEDLRDLKDGIEIKIECIRYDLRKVEESPHA